MELKHADGPNLWQSFRTFRRYGDNYLDPLDFLFIKYGDYVSMPKVPAPALFAFHPDAVEYVLKTNAKNYLKGDGLQEVKPVLGNGLLNSEGEEWREHRRLIGPEFQHKKLESFYPIMARHTRTMLRDWQTRGQEPFNTAPEISRMTYKIAGEAFFGTDVEATAEAIYRGIESTSTFAIRRMRAPARIPLWWPLPSHLRLRREVTEMDQVVFDIIDKRIASASEAQDVLTRLTKSTKLSREQIRDEVMTLLLAGHETTANLLAWTLFLLGRHPGEQEKVRDEVLAVVRGDLPSFEEIPRLRYTKLVLEESMRLYPPVAVVGRKAIADDVVCGYAVARGVNVQLSQWITHRHPEFWSEPKEFRPERFATPEKHHPYAYFPFAAGPRECIGKHMAMMEASLILAAIVKSFRFELRGPKVGFKSLITVRPYPGVTLKLTPVVSPAYGARLDLA